MDKIITAFSVINIIAVTVLIIIILTWKKHQDENAQNTSLTEGLLNDNKNKLTELSASFGVMSRQTAEELQRNRSEMSENQKEMRNEMNASLKAMTEELGKMTKSGYEQQIKLATAISDSLERIRKQNSEENERQNKIIQASIANMQQSNEKKLDQMRETVDEKLTATLTTRLNTSFKTVSEQLENVYKSLGEMKELSNGVTDNVSSLNRVLTNVKARGTWAEVQLEGILEQTIPSMYDKNVSTTGGLARVEFAVKIPSGDKEKEPIWLPIDSKFPMEDYIRLCDAADKADAEATAAARKMLEASVTLKAKEITKYINVPKTTPFAIMYLATEGLYAEIASSKTGLSEKLHNDYNIMVAGPSTITALLNSLSMGFRAVAINEKATEVRNLLSATKAQYDKFGELLEKAKKKVDEAGKFLGDAQNRNRLITKKLKTVDALDYTDSEKILGIDSGESVPETED